MIQVVEEKNSVKEAVCEHCQSKLRYEDGDVKIGAYGCRVIVCPVCGKETFVGEDTPRMIGCVYPMTFAQFNEADPNNKALTDEEINKFVQAVVQNLKNNHAAQLEKDEWNISWSGTGDTLVFGFDMTGDEEFWIVVARKYGEDYLPYSVVDKNW